MVLEEMSAGIRSTLEHGIRLGVGTDSGVSVATHSNFWREMQFLHTVAGLSRAAVLHAAAQVNAEILGLQAVTWRIEPGMDAGLLVIDGDTHEDLRQLSQPWLVVARGHRLPQPVADRLDEIDAQLDTI